MASKDELKKIYAARLKESLKYLKISYREAARRADVPFRSLDNWVRGLSIPRADQLAALAKIGINPNYILLGEDPPILAEEKKPSKEGESRHSTFDAESWKFAWAPVDHVCRNCGARIMVCRATVSPTGAVYKCFTCGKGGYKPEDVCWCGQRFRNSPVGIQHYICLPTSIREKYPEVRELFDSAFRSSGIDPDRLEVGVIPFETFNRIMREAEARRAVAEGGLKAVPKHEKALADIEKALEQEKRYLGTPLAAGLYLEKVWRDYLKDGESHLFVRGLIWKVLEILERAEGSSKKQIPK